MAKLKIYTYPDPVLSQKAQPIARVDKSFRKLADDMLETMYDAPGSGLAANQVGVLQRIVVIDADYEIEEVPEGAPIPIDAERVGNQILTHKNPLVVLNPEIIYREGHVMSSEGCLSVPEFAAQVKRSKKLKLQFQDLDGKTQVISAEGYIAMVIQHEIDHLDGKLFIDRLSPLKKEMVKKRLLQERLEREAELESGLFSSEKSDQKSGKKVKGF